MGEDKVLIVKKNKMNPDKIDIKLRKRMFHGYAPDEFSKVINPKDYNDLALLFEDLEVIVGAPVERAFRKYQDKKQRGFPF